MYLEFIKKYVDKLKKEDINNYALKKELKLDNNELDLIYETIKTRWTDIFNYGIKVINEYKSKLKESTYRKLIEVYENAKKYYNS